MRARLCTMALLCLALAACTRNAASGGELSPSKIEMLGYFGRQTHKVIDFRIDGESLDRNSVSIRRIKDDNGAFDLSRIPLSDQHVLTYQPGRSFGAEAQFALSYRGIEYPFHATGFTRMEPVCEVSKDPCGENVFDPDAGECVRQPLSGAACGPFDCANPGVCVQGECVFTEIPHDAPTCSLAAEPRESTPVWSYSFPEQSWPVGEVNFDADGNSYVVERPSGQFLSLDKAGKERWRAPLSLNSAALDVTMGSDLIFLFDRETQRLRALERSTGKSRWAAQYDALLRMLRVRDELWLLMRTDMLTGNVDLVILDAATGTQKRVQEQERVVEGQTVEYVELVAGADARVFLVGYRKFGAPSWVVVAAIDAATGQNLWAKSLELVESVFAPPVALSGSTLLLSNGVSFDVDTQLFSANPEWQREVLDLDASTFALNPDASAYRAITPRNECLTTVLSHVNVQTGASAWTCYLGSAFTAGGVLYRTPAGSAVLLSTSGKFHKEQLPVLRILDASGTELLHAALSHGETLWEPGAVIGFHGQRLLISQFDTTTNLRVMRAYDIPELVTQ